MVWSGPKTIFRRNQNHKSIFDHAAAWGAFDPENLTESLIEIGHTTGEFDESEAMVLTGRVVVILSYRRRPHAAPEIGLHRVVHQVLTVAGYETSAHLYLSLRKEDILSGSNNDFPLVERPDGVIEIFDAEKMLRCLINLGQQTGEFDEGEAMVLTGLCVNVLRGWQKGQNVSTIELREILENLLIDKRYISSARKMGPESTVIIKTLPLVDAVSTFLTTIEGFLSVKGLA